jgi:hypothetical protein
MAGQYKVPVFIQQANTAAAKRNREPQKRGAKRTVPDSVVAAVRWDYEYGLMGLRPLQRKYSGIIGSNTVARIVYGEMRSEVKADQGASESISNSDGVARAPR